MGVFSRLSDIINSNINSMLDKAEDPEKIARLIIQEMEDCLVEVRSAAARSMADKKEYERDINTLEQTRLDWTAKAELAVEKGREDLARGALSAKQRAEREIDSRRQALTAIEKTPFFKTVRDHTIMGMFAAPQHGGNYKKVGWTQIGYDDSLNFRAPFGAYDKAESTW